MKQEFGLDALTHDPASVVTVGTFDGVHRGHQAVLRYLMARARAQGGRSTVVSFDPHPREVVYGRPVPLLTTIAERAAVMEGLGVDRFVVIPFTEAFSQLPAEAFVADVLARRVGLREIVIGYDHGFGRGREGDRALLATLGARLGFAVDVIPAQVVAQHVVSSTEIRRLLVEEGALALATALLGRPYALSGTVEEGARRGRTLGFPTANLRLDHPRKVVPKHGVYAVRVHTARARYGGMMNIGVRPTFDGAGLHLEVHLFDFDGDLYGTSLRVEFVERIREERKFSGLEALREQLYEDRHRCKAALQAVP